MLMKDRLSLLEETRITDSKLVQDSMDDLTEAIVANKTKIEVLEKEMGTTNKTVDTVKKQYEEVVVNKTKIREVDIKTGIALLNTKDLSSQVTLMMGKVLGTIKNLTTRTVGLESVVVEHNRFIEDFLKEDSITEDPNSSESEDFKSNSSEEESKPSTITMTSSTKPDLVTPIRRPIIQATRKCKANNYQSRNENVITIETEENIGFQFNFEVCSSSRGFIT